MSSSVTPSLSNTFELSGLNQFARSNGDDVQVYVEPTREQLFWVRVLGSLVSPPDNRGSWLARTFRLVGVTPIAHLAWSSLLFQAYLYELFHLTLLARVGHFVLMPLIVGALMLAAAPLHLVGVHPAEHTTTLFAANGALVVAGVLAAWYLWLAIREKMLAWGLVMVLVLAALYVGVNAFYYQNFILDPTQRGWLSALPTPLNPWVWLPILGILTSLSHMLEPNLPPRVTGTNRWMPVREFFVGPPTRPLPLTTTLINLIRGGAQSLFGALDELWATPRLFPIGILRQMWRFGYQHHRQAELNALVKRALDEGNPALDFIGSGGGAFLQLPQERPGR